MITQSPLINKKKKLGKVGDKMSRSALSVSNKRLHSLLESRKNWCINLSATRNFGAINAIK